LAPEAPVGDEAEEYPFDDVRLEAPLVGHLPQRLADPEALPQFTEHERPAEAARVSTGTRS
jgi:hypothetical protein